VVVIYENLIKATSALLIAHKADLMLDSFSTESVFYLHELKMFPVFELETDFVVGNIPQEIKNQLLPLLKTLSLEW